MSRISAKRAGPYHRAQAGLEVCESVPALDITPFSGPFNPVKIIPLAVRMNPGEVTRVVMRFDLPPGLPFVAQPIGDRDTPGVLEPGGSNIAIGPVQT